MAYIGNIPAESYARFETETFTVSATTNYTLSHAVTNENEIRLVINGVVQQPGSGKAYTASGTTLTLSSATASGDVMYCVYLGRALQTVNPPAASVGASQIVDASITSGKLASGVLPTNTPAFLAYKTSNQTVSNTTFTKITFDAEQLDSDSKYDTSNSRFTPTEAGYYFIGAIWRYDTGTDFPDGRFMLYKNGSSVIQSSVVNQDANGMTFSAIIYSDADDYFEMYARQDSGGNVTINGGSTYLSDSTQAQFFGYKIIT